ncbi:hypothetical protein M569_10021, partial [Genlisea aurea]
SSCVIASIFLLFLFLLSLVLYFTLVKPRDPTLAVNAVNLPSFSLLNSSAVTFTLSQYLALHNPNRLALFTHYDTSLRLLTAGAQQQLGLLIVPAAQIGPGRTQYMAATFSAVKADRELHLLELETRLEMAGHLHLLRVFTHRVEVWAYCRVLVSATDGSVLSFHC